MFITKRMISLIFVLLSLLLSGCADMSSEEQQQITGAGVQSGQSFYQQQGGSISKSLTQSLGSSLGDM